MRGLSRRRRWVTGVAVTAVLLSAAATAAAQVIKSPAQAAADSAPPPPSVLSAPVERRVLKDSVILRGTVTAEQSVDVTPAVTGESGGGPVVTKAPVSAGTLVKAATVLLEVSGRPVFALKGGLPVYRDLKPGDEGDDVAQLQKALRDVGHPTGRDLRGFFGVGTKTALTALYTRLGYDPLPARQDGETSVRDAQDGVTAAERAVQDARDALVAGEGSDKELRKQVTRTEEDLARARRTLMAAQEASGPMLPASEVVFLKGFPARVERVSVRVGMQVSGKALTLSAGDLVVSGTLQPRQRSLVRAGQRVEVLSELTGEKFPAEVASVADDVAPQAGGDTGGGGGEDPATQGYAVVVEPTGELDPGLAGQGVRLTVEAAATPDEVLVVPVSAVSAGADGRISVQVLQQDGTPRRVQVTTGATGDGYVAVEPENGRLTEGNRVITGVARAGTAR